VTVAVFMRQAIGCCIAGAIALLSAPLFALLGGCGLVGESATNAFVAPGKFEYHNCEQLDTTGRGLHSREQELAELMARAAQSKAGEFVGAVAYRTELMQTRGQLKQIAEVAERKNCALQSKWLSDRALW
jgi:hypothetical protein